VTTETSAYREKPAHVPIAEYERVVAENNNLRGELATAKKGAVRRETLTAFARGVGWFAVTVPIAAIVVYAVWFCTLRGTAWGENARRNAEREATAYATRVYGTAPLGVVCSDANEGEQRCAVRYNAPVGTVEIRCDDDDPIANDGCRFRRSPAE
jgi:hypothetical protein